MAGRKRKTPLKKSGGSVVAKSAKKKPRKVLSKEVIESTESESDVEMEDTLGSTKNLIQDVKENNPNNMLVSAETVARKTANYIQSINSSKSTKTCHGRKADDSSSSEDCTDDTILSPSKVRQMEKKIDEAEMCLERYRNLNFNLQEKVIAAEERARKAEENYRQLRERYNSLLKEHENGKSTRSHTTVSTATTIPNTSMKKPAYSLANIPATLRADEEGNEQEQSYRSPTPPSIFDEVETENWSTETTSGNVSSLQNASESDTRKISRQSDSGKNLDNETTVDGNESPNTQFYEIHPGIKLPLCAWEQLLKDNFGENKDSPFVKILLLKVFTVGELLAGTISGRVGPTIIKKSKDEGTSVPDPPPSLDAKKIQSLKDCLRKKVELEFAKNVNIPENERASKLKEELNKRTKTTRFNKFVRDRKKTCK